MYLGGHHMDACEGVCERHLESNIEWALMVELSMPLKPTHLKSSFAILESFLVLSASTFYSTG